MSRLRIEKKSEKCTESIVRFLKRFRINKRPLTDCLPVTEEYDCAIPKRGFPTYVFLFWHIALYFRTETVFKQSACSWEVLHNRKVSWNTTGSNRLAFGVTLIRNLWWKFRNSINLFTSQRVTLDSVCSGFWLKFYLIRKRRATLSSFQDKRDGCFDCLKHQQLLRRSIKFEYGKFYSFVQNKAQL